jgi:hypothetical protein
MAYAPSDLTFQTLTVQLPSIPARSSADVTIIWADPLPNARYQVGFAAAGMNFVIKAQTRTAVMVSVTAGDRPVRIGSPLTAAALYY